MVPGDSVHVKEPTSSHPKVENPPPPQERLSEENPSEYEAVQIILVFLHVLQSFAAMSGKVCAFTVEASTASNPGVKAVLANGIHLVVMSSMENNCLVHTNFKQRMWQCKIQTTHG